MKEIKYCSICGISRELASKFYLKSQQGINLCNKHYLQLRLRGKITDASPPDIKDKREYWTKEEENKLVELVDKITSYEEIAVILNKRTSSAINSKVASMGIETKYPNSSNFKAIYQNYDWCYQKYIIEGLSQEEMAIESGCNLRVLKKWLVEKHRITQEYRQENKKLSERQKDLIIGSMLGDGHIDRREEQPMFIEAHAENQKDYIYFKYNILKDLCNNPPVRKEACYSDFNGKSYLCQPSYRFCTRLHDCLKEFRGTTYTYLLSLMNEFSFSIWMLDDAYRGNSNWELCIAEYTSDDTQFAINLLNNRFNLNSKLQKDIRYLRFDARSSREIDKIILRNISNDLDIIKYKITDNKNLHNEEKRIYIEHNNEKILFADFCRNHNLDYKSTYYKVFNDYQNARDILEGLM